jgi:hypothetical protein
MTSKRTLTVVAFILISLAALSLIHLMKPPSVSAQSASYTIVPVGAGALVVGHSSGTITYCTSTILSAFSGLVATDTPVGKCSRAGSLSLPVSNWTSVGGTAGSPQFVNNVNGQVMLCAAFQVNVSETSAQPVGSAIGSCVLQGTAPQ